MSDFSNNVETLFNKLEEFVSSNTVVGEPMEIGGLTIVPLVDVSFGMGTSSDNSAATKSVKSRKDNSLAGVGAKVTPTAMLVINKGSVQMISTTDKSSLNKLIDMIPGFMNKSKDMFSKGNEDEVEE